MKSFLFLLPNNLFQTYVSTSNNDPPVTTDALIQIPDAHRIITLLSWLKTLQPLDPTTITHLTATDLLTLLPSAPVPIIPVLPKPLPTFGSQLKINLSDYPKLKDDKDWCQYHRLLKSTASTHNTILVLTPRHVTLAT